MRSLVQTMYLDSEFGVPTDLQAAGTALENPYVYDSAARDLKAMADKGLVKIVREQVCAGSANDSGGLQEGGIMN